MTKNDLYSALQAFVANGFLEEYYTQENFSVFHFLKTVYVGFAHNGEGSDQMPVKGLLLTKAEADLALSFDACEVFSELCLEEQNSLAFSEELLSVCLSGSQRRKLKSKLKRIYSLPKSSQPDTEWIPNRISMPAGYKLLMATAQFRAQSAKMFNRCRKKFKMLCSICLIGMSLFMVLILTNDLQRQLKDERSYSDFDKNKEAQQYSRVEIDSLMPLASLYNGDASQTKGYYGQYYLWGNRATGKYGILMFEYSSDAEDFVAEDKAYTLLKEPIVLYGMTQAVPSKITDLLTKQEKQEPVVLPGGTISTPDGDEFFVPDHVITTPEIAPTPGTDSIHNDNSRNIPAFLKALGIAEGKDTNFGACFLKGELTPEKINSAANNFLNGLSIVSLAMALALMIPAFYFALRGDALQNAMRDPQLVRNLCISMVIALWPEEAREGGELDEILKDREATNRLLCSILEGNTEMQQSTSHSTSQPKQ